MAGEVQAFSWKTPGEKLVFATFPPAAFHQGKTCFPGFHLENTRGKAESPPGRISPGFPLGKTCRAGPGRTRHFPRPLSPGSPQHSLAAQKKSKLCEFPLTSIKVIFPTEQTVLRHLPFPTISPKWSIRAGIPAFHQGKTWGKPGFPQVFPWGKPVFPHSTRAGIPGFPQGKTR